MNEPSPVKAVFTNDLQYGTLKGNDIINAYNNKKLNWKYMTLENKEIVDGVEYKYVTSDWYILKCDNFPRTEHILINTKNKNAYFTNLSDAFNNFDVWKGPEVFNILTFLAPASLANFSNSFIPDSSPEATT